MEEDWGAESRIQKCRYRTTGKVIYDKFSPKYSTSIIDKIDEICAAHWGFTVEEFITNSDVKCRMGADNGGEE